MTSKPLKPPKKGEKKHTPVNPIDKPNKKMQMEARRWKVYTLWLFGFNTTDISKATRVSVWTVFNDLKVIRSWPDERKVTYQNLRNKMEARVDMLLKQMWTGLEKTRKAEARVRLASLIAERVIDMWKKLIPSEIKLETIGLPPLSREDLEKKENELMKRVPNNG